LITEQDAIRIESWVNEALQNKAKLVVGGKRHGVCYEATILENVDPSLKISCREAFGPVVTIEPFSDFREACKMVNNSVYGLQAGVLTRNIHHAFYAFEEIEVGGVVINDVPSFRVDSMPYGGVKDSGIGREGVRYAIEAMTEMRLMVLNRIGNIV
ncbi:MAG: aldehyde dehydrogenase, partial [Candidatus Zixiibacteriota bacterium]